MAQITATQTNLLHTLFVEPYCHAIENIRVGWMGKKVEWVDLTSDETIVELNFWERAFHIVAGVLLMIPLINAIALAIFKALEFPFEFPELRDVGFIDYFQAILFPPLTRTCVMECVERYLNELNLERFGFRFEPDDVVARTGLTYEFTIQGWWSQELTDAEQEPQNRIRRDSDAVSRVLFDGAIGYQQERLHTVEEIKQDFLDKLRRNMTLNRLPGNFTLQVCLQKNIHVNQEIGCTFEKYFVTPNGSRSCFVRNGG